MLLVQRLSTADMGSAGGGQGGAPPEPVPAKPVAKPEISAELLSRFQALIGEVTQQLMQGATDPNPQTYRADAIALLLAANEQLDEDDPIESPLLYLLTEEKHKSAVLLGQMPGKGLPLMFFKA